MKIVITGASGQLGSYLMDLAMEDHDVLGIDLRPSSFRNHVSKINVGDIRDRNLIENSLRNCDVVIHCAAQVSVVNSIRDPWYDLDVNVGGTITLLNASVNARVKKFIYISSAAVYGDPISIPIKESHPLNPKSPYGASKMSAEQYCKVMSAISDLPFVIIRPFNFYSPRADPKSPYSGVITRFVEWAKKGQPLKIEGDGEQTRDFIHAKDVARMIMMIALSSVRGIAFNCGSGRGTSINALAEAVVEACGKKIDVIHVSPRPGDIRNSISDMSLARNCLQFKSEIDLHQGLLEFFKD
ncbi:MAG: NAD-dependent epimerase/dehydratase family protein [Methanomassiliicoccales archaeon]